MPEYKYETTLIYTSLFCIVLGLVTIGQPESGWAILNARPVRNPVPIETYCDAALNNRNASTDGYVIPVWSGVRSVPALAFRPPMSGERMPVVRPGPIVSHGPLVLREPFSISEKPAIVRRPHILGMDRLNRTR